MSEVVQEELIVEARPRKGKLAGAAGAAGTALVAALLVVVPAVNAQQAEGDKTKAFTAAATPEALAAANTCLAGTVSHGVEGSIGIGLITAYNKVALAHLDTDFDGINNRGVTPNRAVPVSVTVVDAFGVSRTTQIPAGTFRTTVENGQELNQTQVTVPGAYPPQSVTATMDPVELRAAGYGTPPTRVSPVVPCELVVGA